MRRMMIGSSNDSLLFPCCAEALREEIDAVRFPTEGASGLAVVMEHEMLLRKRPSTGDFRPSPIFSDLHTNLFCVMHEEGDAGTFQAPKALPARYRGWVFGTTGPIPDAMRQPDGALGEGLPGFLRKSFRYAPYGATLFAWALGVLYKAGMLDATPDLHSRALRALADGMRSLKAKTGLGALPFDFALVSRHFALGFIGEVGMQRVQLDAIEHCERCARQRGGRRTVPHGHVRTTVLASVPDELPRPWERMAPGQVFLLGADGVLETEPAQA